MLKLGLLTHQTTHAELVGHVFEDEVDSRVELANQTAFELDQIKRIEQAYYLRYKVPPPSDMSVEEMIRRVENA